MCIHIPVLLELTLPTLCQLLLCPGVHRPGGALSSNLSKRTSLAEESWWTASVCCIFNLNVFVPGPWLTVQGYTAWPSLSSLGLLWCTVCTLGHLPQSGGDFLKRGIALPSFSYPILLPALLLPKMSQLRCGMKALPIYSCSVSPLSFIVLPQ